MDKSNKMTMKRRRRWARLYLLHFCVILSSVITVLVLKGNIGFQEPWRVFCAIFSFAGILLLDVTGIYFIVKKYYTYKENIEENG